MADAGRVYLVGAGPGDPDLLTMRAARVLAEADAVVYDRLVSDEVLALAREGAARIYVGKRTGCHHAPQDAINRTLLGLARGGHRGVVRLKGGDPFVFGRGGEEALFLARHGIDFEVVPGVTAATACAAYAGIPLTHRGVADTVQLVAGHCRDDAPLDLDWDALARPGTTLVVYMGLATLPRLCEALLAAGRAGDVPAALVERGTTRGQRRIVATLAGLPAAARAAGVRAPALAIVGEVVALAGAIDWFDPAMPACEAGVAALAGA